MAEKKQTPYLELWHGLHYSKIALWGEGGGQRSGSCRQEAIDESSADRIRPNYRTYPYERTAKQFHTSITASARFAYFFIKAYVVGTHLNCRCN